MDETFFRSAYEADAANRARQSWSEYWGWVGAFYEGKRFPPVPGWSRRQDELLRAHVGDAQLRAALDEVGRALAAQWAKDNAVRKVSTADLQAWGKRFEAASRDKAALFAALDEVRAEVERRTRQRSEGSRAEFQRDS